jgi:ribosomal protein S18 acetylase RimI-like enzyme
VRPDYQGLGVGRLLLSSLELAAREVGLTSLRLSSTLNAAEFYRIAGFTVVKQSRFHHPNGFDLDCIDMEKMLD